MQNNQKDIYILNGNDFDNMKNNPQLEGFKNKNIEVILLTDHIDNFWINSTYHYKNKFFKSISSNDVDLNKMRSDKNHRSNSSEKHAMIIKFIKTVLKNEIADVVISSKLVHSPVCISTSGGGNINLRVEKRLLSQDKSYPRTKKEIPQEISNGRDCWLFWLDRAGPWL
jgi:molecular chaperone HtpG